MASLLKGQQQSAVSKTSKFSIFFPIHKINTVQCFDQQMKRKKQQTNVLVNKILIPYKEQSTS